MLLDVFIAVLRALALVCRQGLHPEVSCQLAQHSAGHARVLLERTRHYASPVQACLRVC